MHRPLATLIVKTGLATGIVLLLTLGTLVTIALPASAVDCPDGTVPIGTVDGDQECVASDQVEPTPEPTPVPSPTDLPPPTEDPATAPPEEPKSTATPESSPAVVVPPPAAPPPEPATEVITPTPAPAPVEKSEAPQEPTVSATPTPAVVAPDSPANAELTGVMAPGDGPRLLWAVTAGASASGLLAAIVAFYLVSIRPYLLARRRPGALG